MSRVNLITRCLACLLAQLFFISNIQAGEPNMWKFPNNSHAVKLKVGKENKDFPKRENYTTITLELNPKLVKIVKYKEFYCGTVVNYSINTMGNCLIAKTCDRNVAIYPDMRKVIGSTELSKSNEVAKSLYSDGSPSDGLMLKALYNSEIKQISLYIHNRNLVL